MRYWLEKKTDRLIKEGNKNQPRSFTDKFFLCSLYGLSLLFRAIVTLRTTYYDLLSPSKKFHAPIVSIGNIVAGGTGKTPLTYALATKLLKLGQVAIVSRGYRSRAEKKGVPVVVNRDKDSAMECGDEPWLLAKKIKEALVVVGRKREKGVRKAFELGAKVVLLDDGMQKRGLYRDFEIVILNGEDLFGGGFFLPRGYLREAPCGLERADAVVVNGGVEKDKIQNALKCYTKAPILWADVVYEDLCFIKGLLPSEFIESPLDFLKLRKVALFCGIGAPERFLEGVKKLGCQVVETMFLADHEAICKKKIETLSQKAKALNAELILCTEKDAVKLPDCLTTLPIAFLTIDLKVYSEENEWELLIEKIEKQMKMEKK